MGKKLVYVKESGIHGKGLFAKKTIKEDAIISELKGKPASDNEPYVL